MARSASWHSVGEYGPLSLDAPTVDGDFGPPGVGPWCGGRDVGRAIEDFGEKFADVRGSGLKGGGSSGGSPGDDEIPLSCPAHRCQLHLCRGDFT